MFFCMLIALLNPSNELLNNQGRLHAAFISFTLFEVCEYISDCQPSVMRSGRAVIISSIHTQARVSQRWRVACWRMQ